MSVIIDQTRSLDVIDENEELDTTASLDSSVCHYASYSTDPRTISWADSPYQSDVHLSFYYPNKLTSKPSGLKRSDESVNTTKSTDWLGMAMEAYRKLTTWKKLKLYELLCSFVILCTCLIRQDIVSILILFILCNHGFSSAYMIPHYCYLWILSIAALSMICRYVIQLPIINQCVDSDGYYYFTVSVFSLFPFDYRKCALQIMFQILMHFRFFNF